ncbi:unnamed protein product [Pleuronectes platessa]|uniref:Uncharacterized protein n=1 Tax=Pleuronectes platessa TaxID=8262 RepID=A0A9N7VNM4_PLEPL|nr:unnamed protein product [Pleuronectes platessa]
MLMRALLVAVHCGAVGRVASGSPTQRSTRQPLTSKREAIKGVKELGYFSSASIMLGLSSSLSGIRKVGNIHGALSHDGDGFLRASQRWPDLKLLGGVDRDRAALRGDVRGGLTVETDWSAASFNVRAVLCIDHSWLTVDVWRADLEADPLGFPWSAPALAARRQPRRIAGRGPPRQRRVPPAGAVAEVIREKGPTCVQSRRRRPPYPVPSNGPPSAPATDTAPRVQEKESTPHH